MKGPQVGTTLCFRPYTLEQALEGLAKAGFNPFGGGGGFTHFDCQHALHGAPSEMNGLQHAVHTLQPPVSLALQRLCGHCAAKHASHTGPSGSHDWQHAAHTLQPSGSFGLQR